MRSWSCDRKYALHGASKCDSPVGEQWWSHHVYSLQVRLDEGDHVNSTPLIFSCFRDQVECTQLLVESGADIHCFEKHGLTVCGVGACFST